MQQQRPFSLVNHNLLTRPTRTIPKNTYKLPQSCSITSTLEPGPTSNDAWRIQFNRAQWLPLSFRPLMSFREFLFSTLFRRDHWVSATNQALYWFDLIWFDLIWFYIVFLKHANFLASMIDFVFIYIQAPTLAESTVTTLCSAPWRRFTGVPVCGTTLWAAERLDFWALPVDALGFPLFRWKWSSTGTEFLRRWPPLASMGPFRDCWRGDWEESPFEAIIKQRWTANRSTIGKAANRNCQNGTVGLQIQMKLKGEAIRICFSLFLRTMKYVHRLRKETIWIFQRFDLDMGQKSTTNHYENDFLQQETIGDYRMKKRPKNKKQKLFKEAVHFENVYYISNSIPNSFSMVVQSFHYEWIYRSCSAFIVAGMKSDQDRYHLTRNYFYSVKQ